MTTRSAVRRWLAPNLLALSLPWAVVSASAQPRPGGEGREPGRGGERPHRGEERDREAEHGERMLDMLDKGLELTGEQKIKVKAIMDEGKPQMEAIKKQMKELQEKIKRTMFAQTEKMRGILTDEQKMKFDEMKLRMMERMHGGGDGPRRGMRRGAGPMGRSGPPDEGEDGGGRMRGPMDGDDRPMSPPEMWRGGGRPGPGGPPPFEGGGD